MKKELIQTNKYCGTGLTQRQILLCACLAVLLSLFESIISVLLLKNLYRFIGGEFSVIFSQISCAVYTITPWLSFVLFFLYGWQAQRLWSKSKLQRVIIVVIGVIVFVVTAVICLYYTKVNGVCFGDVLSSLIPLLIKGVL